MIPAMTPASDDGSSTTMTITVTGTNTATINYDGGSLDIDLVTKIETGLYLDGDEIKRTTNQNLSGYQVNNGNEYYWTCPAGNNRLEIGSETLNFGVEKSILDFDSASAGKDLDGNDNMVFISKLPGSKLFHECTEEERRIMWESFFVTSPYKAWDTPEPSNNDVNTVLITTVISMLFISIAVVAVRSFGGRE